MAFVRWISISSRSHVLADKNLSAEGDCGVLRELFSLKKSSLLMEVCVSKHRKFKNVFFESIFSLAALMLFRPMFELSVSFSLTSQVLLGDGEPCQNFLFGGFLMKMMATLFKFLK